VDYDNIETALQLITQTAATINNRKRHLEELTTAARELENITEFVDGGLRPADSVPPYTLFCYHRLTAHPSEKSVEDLRLYVFSHFLLESRNKLVENTPSPAASPSAARLRSFSGSSSLSQLALTTVTPQTVTDVHRFADYHITFLEHPSERDFSLQFIPLAERPDTAVFFRRYTAASGADKMEIKDQLLKQAAFHALACPPRNLALVIEVISGHDLPVADLNGFSDPFCKLRYGATRYQTATIYKNLNPVWNSRPFSFVLTDELPFIHISVWDEDLVGKDFLGSLDIPIEYFASLTTPVSLQDFWIHDTRYANHTGRLRLRISVQADASMQGSFPGIKLRE
jgi:hypothetical protein